MRAVSRLSRFLSCKTDSDGSCTRASLTHRRALRMRAGPNNEAREGGFCPALKPLYRRRPTFKSESCISEQASPLLRGFKAKAALDLFDAGSSAVYFVGDPEEIADNVKV